MVRFRGSVAHTLMRRYVNPQKIAMGGRFMGSKGGTQKHCPKCNTITVCKAVNPSELGKKSSQRWYKTQHKDINWFRRGLICQTCKHRWLSAEVPESLLTELVELRDALSDIKSNAEAYMEESEKASASLGKLNDSLSVLQALKLYEKAE